MGNLIKEFWKIVILKNPKECLVRLTLIRPGFLVSLNTGEGWISPTDFLSYLTVIFSSKWTKHDLKWKLGSLSTKRVIEHIAMMYSFARRGRQSSLVWLWKFASFWYEKFENPPFLTYIGNMYRGVHNFRNDFQRLLRGYGSSDKKNFLLKNAKIFQNFLKSLFFFNITTLGLHHGLQPLVSI